MCCLRYEFEAYKDFKSRAPKKKTLIDTPLGKARIVEYNTPREQLVLRLENGKIFRVDLADMTSTEENKQRCEAQGCSCRPDCVTRDVLERLESPELALALMELDRKNGVDVGDGLDTADRIVASGPTPRRKRMREEEAAKFEQGGSGRRSRKGAPSKGRSQDAEEEQVPQQSRRHRRRAGAAEQAVPQAAEAKAPRTDADFEPAQPSRRRRHRAGAAPAPTAGTPHEAASPAEDAPAKSRRRKHTPSGTEAASGEGKRRSRPRKPETPSVADQIAEGEVKIQRRRPGDGGGAKSRPATDGPARSGSDDAEGAPKKRRRRRSRKPKQDGGDAAASAE